MLYCYRYVLFLNCKYFLVVNTLKLGTFLKVLTANSLLVIMIDHSLPHSTWREEGIQSWMGLTMHSFNQTLWLMQSIDAAEEGEAVIHSLILKNNLKIEMEMSPVLSTHVPAVMAHEVLAC